MLYTWVFVFLKPEWRKAMREPKIALINLYKKSKLLYIWSFFFFLIHALANWDDSILMPLNLKHIFHSKFLKLSCIWNITQPWSVRFLFLPTKVRGNLCAASASSSSVLPLSLALQHLRAASVLLTEALDLGLLILTYHTEISFQQANYSTKVFKMKAF